jgi:hypothetical protein
VDEASEKMLWTALLPEFGAADLGRTIGAADAVEPPLHRIPKLVVHEAELGHLHLDALSLVADAR